MLYPDITGQRILWVLGGGAVAALVAAGATLASGRGRPAVPALDRVLRPTWRTTPLQELGPNQITGATRVWMIVLGGYLLVTIGMVMLRLVQLALA